MKIGKQTNGSIDINPMKGHFSYCYRKEKEFENYFQINFHNKTTNKFKSLLF